MKITIVTVCYNASAMIESTIQSVLAQTYQNIEYIVIDGGSADGTVDIIKKYEHSISKWISEPDRGIYDAMNKGIELATGDYINFMNAGDAFYDDKVISNIFESTDNIGDVIFGNAICLFRNGLIQIQGKSFNKNDIHLPFVHQSSFVRAILAKEYLFNLKYKIAADYDFFYRIYLNKYTFQYFDMPISRYDMNGYSSENIINTYREVAMSNKSDGTIQYYFRFMMLQAKIICKKFIPSKILHYYRHTRFGMNN